MHIINALVSRKLASINAGQSRTTAFMHSIFQLKSASSGIVSGEFCMNRLRCRDGEIGRLPTPLVLP
jgi:hypothetical protein